MKYFVLILCILTSFSLYAQSVFECPPGTNQVQERTSEEIIVKFCHDKDGEKLGPLWHYKLEESEEDKEPLVLTKKAVAPKPDGSTDVELLARFEYSGNNRAPTKEFHFMKNTVIIKKNEYIINSDLSIDVNSKCVSRPKAHYVYEDHIRAEHRRAMREYAYNSGPGIVYNRNSMASYHYYPGGIRVPTSVAVENFNNLAQSTSSFSNIGTQKEVDCINAEVLSEGYGNHVFQRSRGTKQQDKDNSLEANPSNHSSGRER